MKIKLANPLSWLVVTVALLLLLAGCAGAPVGEAVDPAQASTMRYQIAPGDTLKIFVRDNPGLSIDVPVRPDGRISIPLVQSIMAAGQTPDQLAKSLETRLATYIRSPMVTVIVTNFVGAFDQQVRIVGQAATPKALPYRHGMTLLDVMIEVGGLTKFADGNDAKLVRQLADGSKQTLSVRLADLMNGAVKYNLVMRPGDILIIPRSLF